MFKPAPFTDRKQGPMVRFDGLGQLDDTGRFVKVRVLCRGCPVEVGWVDVELWQRLPDASPREARP